MASKTSTNKKPANKKPVVSREDPVKRAERLLAEAKAKAKVTAEKQLDGARNDLEVAIKNRDKWEGFVQQRQARVQKLESDLGLDNETPAEAQSYANALASDEG